MASHNLQAVPSVLTVAAKTVAMYTCAFTCSGSKKYKQCYILLQIPEAYALKQTTGIYATMQLVGLHFHIQPAGYRNDCT